MEDDDADLALAGDGTQGDWPWMNGLDSDVDDKGVEAWWN